MAAPQACQTGASTWSKLPLMKAGILAVGTELLGSDRLDTNSLVLTRTLHQFGVEVCRKAVLPDNEEEIASELGRYLTDLDLVLVTGGLGPTSDDLTREAAARALGAPLRRDADLLAALEARFRKWGHAMPASNACQADVIEGAEVLSNPRGTAELDYLIRSDLEPWLQEHAGGRQQETLVLRVACMSESALEDMLGPIYAEFGAHNVSVLASPGDIQVRFRAHGVDQERGEILEAMVRSAERILGSSLYGRGAKSSLEGIVGGLLLGGGRTVSTAESCTAGLLAERLTRVAGSSEYFVGGVVVYSNRLKERLLGVSTESLEQYGAVSLEVVCEMAQGAVERLESDFAIAISGVAGPAGGTAEKPVGTVHLALAEAGAETAHQELHLPGNRQRIRLLASQWALDMLRRRLLSVGAPQ
jgi:nicotinamide-nucleotide amidase